MGLLSKKKKVQHDLHNLVGHILDDRLRVIRLVYISPRQWLYEAEPPSVGKTRCAIKVLGDPSGREPGAFYRLKVVANKIRGSKSPRIEHMLECGTLHDLTPYLVTAWESHDSLYEYLRRQKRPLSWDIVQPLLIEIAEGLYELHQANVVHGDLRAQHVLLREPPKDAVLIDYGVSASFGTPPVPGMDKSLAYWAPERLTFAAATPATDLYSFGVLMYLCLTNTLPFTPDFAQLQSSDLTQHLDPQSALAEYHQKYEVPPITADIPTTIKHLVYSLMEKEVGKRPNHIGDVLEILKNPSQSPIPTKTTSTSLVHSIPAHNPLSSPQTLSITTPPHLTTFNEEYQPTPHIEIDPKAILLLIIVSMISVVLGILLIKVIL